MTAAVMEAPAVVNIHDARPCPLCQSDMPIEDVRCALSRYMNLSICSHCGNVEALRLARLNDNPNNRTCLYQDTVAGIMLVAEHSPGYVELWPQADRTIAPEYVTAVNHRHGLEPSDMSDIVYSSMFLASGR